MKFTNKPQGKNTIQSKNYLNIFSIVLLLFLGIAAVGGGILLITDPSGSSLGLPPELINEIPFENYFIPGMILFIINGLSSFLVAILTLFKVKKYGWLIIFQGCILMAWLTAELFMSIFDLFLQSIFYSIAVLLIISGTAIIRKTRH